MSYSSNLSEAIWFHDLLDGNTRSRNKLLRFDNIHWKLSTDPYLSVQFLQSPQTSKQTELNKPFLKTCFDNFDFFDKIGPTAIKRDAG